MTAAVGLCLAVAACIAWLAATAFVRLPTPLARLHCAAFVNVAGGAAVTLAALFSDGATPRALKVAMIWLVTLASGALLSFRAARAIHLRGGDTR